MLQVLTRLPVTPILLAPKVILASALSIAYRSKKAFTTLVPEYLQNKLNFLLCLNLLIIFNLYSACFALTFETKLPQSKEGLLCAHGM